MLIFYPLRPISSICHFMPLIRCLISIQFTLVLQKKFSLKSNETLGWKATSPIGPLWWQEIDLMWTSTGKTAMNWLAESKEGMNSQTLEMGHASEPRAY